MYKFMILVSTVDDKFFKQNRNIDIPYLVINQLIKKKHSLFKNENLLFSYNESGLSRSRNRAIQQASADICLIADDDVEFDENIENIVLKTFNKNPEADIITFQIKTPDNKQYKNYKENSFYHNHKTIMSVSSIEIAFRRKSIVKNNLFFDESFGLGTNIPTGEEIIFLSDALNKGLKILYIPIPIVTHPSESSGKDYDNSKLIMAKGAMFYRLFGKMGYAISLLFVLKKRNLSSTYNYFQFASLMLEGIKNYKGSKHAE